MAELEIGQGTSGPKASRPLATLYYCSAAHSPTSQTSSLMHIYYCNG